MSGPVHVSQVENRAKLDGLDQTGSHNASPSGASRGALDLTTTILGVWNYMQGLESINPREIERMLA